MNWPLATTEHQGHVIVNNGNALLTVVAVEMARLLRIEKCLRALTRVLTITFSYTFHKNNITVFVRAPFMLQMCPNIYVV